MGISIAELTGLCLALAALVGAVKAIWRASRPEGSRQPSLYSRIEDWLAEVRNVETTKRDLAISNRGLIVANADRDHLMEELEDAYRTIDRLRAEVSSRASSTTSPSDPSGESTTSRAQKRPTFRGK